MSRVVILKLRYLEYCFSNMMEGNPRQLRMLAINEMKFE